MDQDKNKILIKNINNWKSKLLDLGMKNKSLNFNIKTTKTISSKIKIVYPNLLDFLKSLDTSSKESYEISNYKMLNLYSTDALKNQTLFSSNLEDITKNNSFYKTKIYTQFGYYETKDILDLTLKKIYKISKTWKDEYSIDVLYLAFGFLKWYEANDSNETRYAPLLLLPVELKKSLNTWSIQIKKAENFIQNEALVKKLKNDFDIDAELNLNKDDLINTYKSYSEQILNQVIDKRWEIIDDVYLANFDFSRINIYKDIEANINNIVASDFFKAIVDQTNNLDNDISVVNENNLDTKLNILEQYKILDADSSQEIAIQNAILGKSFVLQGPPGTGKSQTITNIITELISRGKKFYLLLKKTQLYK
uniref:ATP-dependent RecD-like DNA helicase n=1 Tax=Mycoplasma feriruminatoris TaxID=1179777 RepID=A0A654IH31_9MOLU|nr:ATP-dependent RecD-like DNA helicase [Mycoplasma feriruminatoris]